MSTNRNLLKWRKQFLAGAAIAGLGIGVHSSFAATPAAVEQTATVVPRGDNQVVSPPTPVAKTQLRVGDRIKVTFVESIDVPGTSQSAAIKSYFQRADVSGEFQVDNSGVIALPIIGSAAVADWSIEDVSGQLAEKFAKLMGRPAQVTINIVQRNPIYVLGRVRNPGAFDHKSGMSVMQALALSGGTDKPEAEFDRMLQLYTERARAEKARAALLRLLPRKARLQTVSRKGQQIAVPKRLIQLVGDEQAGELMRSEIEEGALLDSEWTDRETLLVSEIAAANEEVAALRKRVAKFKEQVAIRREQVGNMDALLKRGNTSKERLMTAKRELLDLEGRQDDAATALATATQQFKKREAELARERQQQRLKFRQELTSIDNEIAEAEIVLRSARKLADLETHVAASSRTNVITILRREKGKLRTIKADEMSDLEPGDVVRVEPGPAQTSATKT